MDLCTPGSYVHRILQARIQEWVAVPFSRGSSQFRDQTTDEVRIHKKLYIKKKKGFYDLDNDDGVVTHLQPNILECEVKRALGSITINKASGGDGIPTEVFQIPNDDAVKVLHSICHSNV